MVIKGVEGRQLGGKIKNKNERKVEQLSIKIIMPLACYYLEGKVQL